MRTTKIFTLLFCLVNFATFANGFGENPTPQISTSRIPTIPSWMPALKMCSGNSFNFNPAVVVTPVLWSATATWTALGTTKPVAGSAVAIPMGTHIILDEDTPALAGLTIDGTLEFDRKNVSLTADWIMVMGKLEVGTPSSPFTHQATINLIGNNVNQNIMGMGTRGLMVMGGQLELHGTPPTTPWTKINAHGAQGATSLSLIQSVNWKVNDQIAIAPTDYYEAGLSQNSITQRVSLTSVSGTSLGLSAGLNAQRWGLLQYTTTSGMSLTNVNPVTPPSSSGTTPTVLDERAEVANLTRNIVIQAPNDALWTGQNFGCHIMVMRNGMTQGVAHINGIEIRRGGQMGKVGRYPFHWHMLSYDGSTTLADAAGQYIRNSSVNQSAHRGIVIHGTNGVEISKNVVYDVRGHGIFTEDASERRNLIDGNLVLHVRNPSTALKIHESDASERGSSGYWVSNPDNIISNNTAADCGANGFWFAFTTQTWGLSSGITMNPSRTLFGVFENNTTHSNLREGIMMDLVESDNDGNTVGFKYNSTTDGLDPQWPYPNLRRYTLSRYTTWKNGGSGIWNRAVWPDNFGAVSADNQASYFAGAGDEGLIERILAVGTSLNHMMNGTDRSNNTGTEPTPVALASYHSAFDIKNNIIVNFPAVAGVNSGAFATNDYYLVGVDKGLARNVGNLLINSHPGVRTVATEPQFKLAGALWDPHDYWGGSPTQDNYYVYDTPFFTDGLAKTIIAPSTAVSGGVIVEGPYFSFGSFVINQANSPYSPYMAININRVNSSLATIGNWSVAEGQSGQLLPNMRHFATHPTGMYELSFPTIATVSDLIMDVANMQKTTDYQVISMEYSGNYTISNLFTSIAYNLNTFTSPVTPTSETHVFAPVADLAAVISAPFGEVFWQDKANNKVWMKIRGGLRPNDPNLPPNSDYNLYSQFVVRAFGAFAPLPVELLDFRAKLNANKTVNLTWETASETNNKGFDVEKSKDATNWTKIDFVVGAGTSTKNNKYEYTDNAAFSGTNYYRLKQIDHDGRNEYSNVETVSNDKNKNIQIYPNPINDYFNIETPNTSILNVELVSIDGKITVQKTVNAPFYRFDTSSIPKGIYFINVLYETQERGQYKVVIQ